MKRLNILWLSHLIPYPPKGGVLQRSYNLLRETAKRHRVYLIAFAQRDLLRRTFADVETGRGRARRELARFCEDVRFVDIPCESTRFGKYRLALESLAGASPYTIKWLESAEMEAEIRHMIAAVHLDVIHFDTISLAPYMRLVTNQKTVLDHHNIESHMMIRRAGKERNWLKRLYFLQEGLRMKNYERKACGRFDANITCSILDSERLKQMGEVRRVEEIPNGVDLDYFVPTPGLEVPGRLVFAGGLNWYPNRSAMLYFAREVWPLLKRNDPGVTMDVIGADPPPELVALSRRDAAFMVHGFVDDVRPFLDRASVYVCPIRDGGGTKLKMLDAFAMAKPTVAHPIACEGIDAKPGVHVLLASNADEYVNQIRRLREDAGRRRELGRQARELVEARYSYRRIGAALSEVYESVCAADPARSAFAQQAATGAG